jgi:putative hemolysin
VLSEILIIFALVVANGFFAGAEIAVVTLRLSRLKELADTGDTSARAVLALRQEPERFLATVQIGITVVGATAAAFGGASIAARIEPAIARLSWLAEHAEALALGLVVVSVSFLSIVLGELVPKSLALRAGERLALFIGRPLLGLAWLARPFVWILTKSSNILLKPFGDRTSFTEARHSLEELHQLVDEAMQAGTVDPAAAEIVSRALTFPELSAGDVMIPRSEVVMVRADVSREELRRLLLEHSHTRMPVYEENMDNVVGCISVKDVLALAWEQQLIVLADLIRPAYFVPASKRAVDLLHAMRRDRAPFAVVVDEQGGMSGIVTIEDLTEELVGEIFSEHDPHVPQLVASEADGSYTVAGMATIREINRALRVGLPTDGEWNTVNGLCVALAGHIPVVGERLVTAKGHELVVLEASPRRVASVRLIPAPGASSFPPASS